MWTLAVQNSDGLIYIWSLLYTCSDCRSSLEVFQFHELAVQLLAENCQFITFFSLAARKMHDFQGYFSRTFQEAWEPCQLRPTPTPVHCNRSSWNTDACAAISRSNQPKSSVKRGGAGNLFQTSLPADVKRPESWYTARHTMNDQQAQCCGAQVVSNVVSYACIAVSWQV